MNQPDFSFDEANESTGFLLWQVTNLWQRAIKKALEPCDLTHAQFVLLASTHWLAMGQTAVTQVLLANHTKIDPMTTSTVLRTLQAKGLLERHEHATDTRAKTVALTQAGIAQVQIAIKIVEDFDRQFFASLQPNIGAFNARLLALLE
jgi:MarR family transcriptional regulator, organic hydroperoxide resistance regulator